MFHKVVFFLCCAALEKRRSEHHPHLVGPEVRSLSQLLHRYLGLSAAAAAATGDNGELLPRCDADLLRRHPFTPFATESAVSAASLNYSSSSSADTTSRSILPPSYVTPADWACASGGGAVAGAAAALGRRDGLFLQVRVC